MRNKSDEELFDILNVHTQDWVPEAVEAARIEFRSRGLDAPTLNIIETNAAQTREKEGAHLGWGLRLLAFFFSTVCLGIPVLLAHRHFVEKGERRKANEWATWGLNGFLFYLGLGVVRLILAYARK